MGSAIEHGGHAFTISVGDTRPRIIVRFTGTRGEVSVQSSGEKPEPGVYEEKMDSVSLIRTQIPYCGGTADTRWMRSS